MPRVETPFGAIGFAEQGSGGVPIVFLHGVGSDKSVWKPQLEHFGRSRLAVAFDYPGYGDSAPAAAGMTRDDYAAAILAAMDGLGIGAAHVCGLSLGGVVAIAMHAAAPERCASLVIADSFAVHPDGRGIHQRGLEASTTIGMRALAEARAPLLLGAGASAELRDEVVETMARIDPAAFAIGLEAVWLADQRGRAAAIDVPTLVIVGAEDKVTPPNLSRQLADEVAGAEMHEIAGAGHLANIEKPHEFNRLVEAFVERVEARGGVNG
ncbi:MAG: alpha/beta fold hydrolase [Pseudomonadota bacterium]|nr:alpha/beta fold hydrolase [Sphingomonas sp.]MDQ3478888.1 alpha/beta fold hydrolase [Pseudomonadota bacterium]